MYTGCFQLVMMGGYDFPVEIEQALLESHSKQFMWKAWLPLLYHLRVMDYILVFLLLCCWKQPNDGEQEKHSHHSYYFLVDHCCCCYYYGASIVVVIIMWNRLFRLDSSRGALWAKGRWKETECVNFCMLFYRGCEICKAKGKPLGWLS